MKCSNFSLDPTGDWSLKRSKQASSSLKEDDQTTDVALVDTDHTPTLMLTDSDMDTSREVTDPIQSPQAP